MSTRSRSKPFQAVIGSLRVSGPRHGILRPETDGIRYEDRGSLNGSFVNEERLEGVCVLKDGDVLQVGQSAVRVTTSK